MISENKEPLNLFIGNMLDQALDEELESREDSEESLDVAAKRLKGVPKSSVRFIDERIIEESPYAMQEKELERRMYRNERGRYITQLYVCIIVTLGTISLGYLHGTSAPFLRNRNEQLASKSLGDRYASAIPLGRVFGTVANAMLGSRMGPRKIMIVVVPASFLTWLLVSISNNEHWKIAMVCCCAMFSFVNSVCGKTLLADAAHPGNLYHLNLISYSGTGFGIMLAFIFGYSKHLSYYSTGFAVIILALQFVLLFYCPESPFYLYSKHPSWAEKSLIFFRGYNKVQDIRTIAKDCENQNLSVSGKYMLFKRAVYKAILIIMALTTFKAASGYSMFLLVDLSVWKYSSVFGKNLDSFGKIEDAMIIGLCYCTFPTLMYFVPIKWGIKKPLYISATLVTISLSMHAIHLYLLAGKYFSFLRLARAHIFNRAMHIFSYHMGYGLCEEIAVNEYIPDEVYTYVFTLTEIYHNVLIYVLVRVMILLNITQGLIMLAVLAFISFVGIFFCYYFVVESKGRTLKQIQLQLRANPIGNRSVSRRRIGT